jgi:hypothetical protein
MMRYDREPITRRVLIAGGIQSLAGLTAAIALNGNGYADDIPGGKRAVKIRFGLTTYTWGKDWNIPTLIANCTTARAFGVELRTSENYVHGVEPEVSMERRREVRKRFDDSPVTLVGLASSVQFDSPDPEQVKEAIERAKAHLRLSHDLGASGVRVFPNDFHQNIPRARTIAQIAKSLNVIGLYAADCGQQVRLEAHGSAGDLASIRSIMDQVTERSVRVKLNSDPRDAAGRGFEYNFNLVKGFLGDTLHAHDFKDKQFPNQLQIDLLVKMGWSGWVLLESEETVPDRVQALREQREVFERMAAKALGQ